MDDIANLIRQFSNILFKNNLIKNFDIYFSTDESLLQMIKIRLCYRGATARAGEGTRAQENQRTYETNVGTLKELVY